MNAPTPFYRYRLEFRKEGDLRWIGHHDLARTMERLFRRLELPLRMSRGYHPKPKIRFASALALGIASDVEWVEVELTEPQEERELLEAVRSEAPEGLEFTRVTEVSGKMPQMATATYAIAVPTHREDALRRTLQQLWNSSQWLLERPGRSESVDVRAGLQAIALQDGELTFTVAAGRRGAIRPREVLQALQAEDLELDGAVLRRIAVTFDADPSILRADPVDKDTTSSPDHDGIDPLVLESLDRPPS